MATAMHPCGTVPIRSRGRPSDAAPASPPQTPALGAPHTSPLLLAPQNHRAFEAHECAATLLGGRRRELSSMHLSNGIWICLQLNARKCVA